MADPSPRTGKHHRIVRVALAVLADGPVEGMTAVAIAERTHYAVSTLLTALHEARKAGVVRGERERRPGHRTGFGPVMWKGGRQ